jgi:hypothetical protein
MQDFNSYPSFQPEQADDLAEELYPDIFSGAFPAIDPGPATSAELYSDRSARRSTAKTAKQAVRTERSTDRVKAVQDAPAPISLVDALRTTITRNQPKKEKIVIAGEKKRLRNTDIMSWERPAWHLTPRLRLIILSVVTVLILLSILLFPIYMTKM